MTRRRRKRAALVAAASLFASLLCAPDALAEKVTHADLQAISNALGFLNGLSRGAPIVVGVLYAPDGADAKQQAVQTAGALEAIPGPNQSSFRGEPISVKDLAQSSTHLDAVLLLPGAESQAQAIAEAARHRRLLTISTDPSCIDAKCCVLMVRTTGRTQIVLDTQMADSVGANFSSVFTMMVERR